GVMGRGGFWGSWAWRSASLAGIVVIRWSITSRHKRNPMPARDDSPTALGGSKEVLALGVRAPPDPPPLPITEKNCRKRLGYPRIRFPRPLGSRRRSCELLRGRITLMSAS